MQAPIPLPRAAKPQRGVMVRDRISEMCKAMRSGGDGRVQYEHMRDGYFNRDDDRLIAYLRDFLDDVTIIDAPQTRFMAEFSAWAMLNSVQLRRSTVEAALSLRRRGCLIANEHIFLVVDSASSERGYNSIELSHAIRWVVHFFGRNRIARERYNTILDLPRTYVLHALDPGRRTAHANFGPSLVANVLVPNSPDAHLWWRSSECSVVNTLYPDAHTAQLYEDSMGMEKLSLRMDSAMDVVAKISGAPAAAVRTTHALVSHALLDNGLRAIPDLTAERLSLTAYLYLTYSLARTRGLPAENGVALGLSRPEDTPQALFPVLASMIAGTQLLPCHRTLLDLYLRDNGASLMALSCIADDIRTLLVIDNYPTEVPLSNCTEPSERAAAQRENARRFEKRVIIKALYERTRDCWQATSLYRDMCRSILSDPRAARVRRQAYVGTTRIEFGKFLHDLNNQLYIGEYERLEKWLLNQFSKIFRTQPSDITEARSLHDQHNPHARAEAAQRILAHLHECESRLIVLRFPDYVCAHEIQLSCDYFCALYPYLSAAGSAFFVGVDSQGPYMVADARHYAMLMNAMLLVSLQTSGYRHNVPLFPLLTRLYFSRLESDGASAADSASTTQAYFAAPRPLESVEGPSIDDHSLYCFVQVLAYWFGLVTELPETVRATRNACHNGSSNNNGTAWRKRERTDASAKMCYVPNFNGNFFCCMRMLHRFAARLHNALGNKHEGSVSDGVAEALASFIELHRPRSVKRSLLLRIVESLADSTSPVDVTTARMCTLLATNGGGQSADPESAKRKRTEDEFVTISWSAGVLPDDQHQFGLGEEETITLAHWYIYVPALSGRLPLGLIRELFLEGGMKVLGRDAVKRGTFRCSVESPSDRPRNAQIADDYTANYNLLFVVPYANSQRRLGVEFVGEAEPIEPLAQMIRSIEAVVAPGKLGGAVANAAGFDFGTFLGEKRDDLVPDSGAQAHAGLPSPDGRALLPIQYWPKGPVFMEHSFSLVSFAGSEYARYVARMGIRKEEVSSEAFSTEPGSMSIGSHSSAQMVGGANFARTVDICVRFSDLFNPSAVAAGYSPHRSYREFSNTLLRFMGLNLELKRNGESVPDTVALAAYALGCKHEYLPNYPEKPASTRRYVSYHDMFAELCNLAQAAPLADRPEAVENILGYNRSATSSTTHDAVLDTLSRLKMPIDSKPALASVDNGFNRAVIELGIQNAAASFCSAMLIETKQKKQQHPTPMPTI